jgi:hypothetical protein
MPPETVAVNVIGVPTACGAGRFDVETGQRQRRRRIHRERDAAVRLRVVVVSAVLPALRTQTATRNALLATDGVHV